MMAVKKRLPLYTLPSYTQQQLGHLCLTAVIHVYVDSVYDATATSVWRWLPSYTWWQCVIIDLGCQHLFRFLRFLYLLRIFFLKLFSFLDPNKRMKCKMFFFSCKLALIWCCVSEKRLILFLPFTLIIFCGNLRNYLAVQTKLKRSL